MYDSDRATWSVTEGIYSRYGLQSVIDCAKEGDVLSLKVSSSSAPISPQEQIVVRRNLTIDGAEKPSRTKLTCPAGKGLFRIE